MIPPLTETTNDLILEEGASFQLKNWQVEIISYLGLYTTDIYYFKVNISEFDVDSPTVKLGLLRVGSVDGALDRELKLRETLSDYKLVAELLADSIQESVKISLPSQQPSQIYTTSSEAIATPDLNVNVSPENNDIFPDTFTNSATVENTSEYLEEEFYPEQEINSHLSNRKLLLLTDFPNPENTLDTWLAQDNSLEASLSLTSQVCQFFRYAHQRNWCFVNIIPNLVEMGTPIKFFDLTSAYPLAEKLNTGLLGDYCAPELAFSNHPIDELMSTYTVGALLYHAIHKQPVNQNDLTINPIPRIYQIISISLADLPEERFALGQMLSLLLETRQIINNKKIHWNIASNSTIGLSSNRLQNEDSYGIRQQLNNSETLILGVVADGMGGMAQGEVASKLAVQTVLEEPIPLEFKTTEQRSNWLVSLVQKANENIANQVKDGGTTLSLVLAIAQELMIAHVGDSRIYLLRKEKITQLSEDHSLVAMLVASGQITPEESQSHPDRNVLIKSLGSKRSLSDGYVQDLSRFYQNLSITLEHSDILLLCSDGTWDLVPPNELAEIFTQNQPLQLSVDETIKRVLERGAHDNATLLALECCISKSY